MTQLATEESKIQHTVQAGSSEQALHFYIDALQRSEKDRKAHPEIFECPALLERVETVKELIQQFFRKNNDEVYVTCRYNRGNPFVSVKPRSSNFTQRTRTEKYEMLLNPIRQGMVGFVEEKNTSTGWFVRVYYKNQHQQEAK